MENGGVRQELQETMEEVLDLAMSMGYHLLMCGAEISRVEEAVSRLLSAYGMIGDVFAIPNCLILTLSPNGAVPVTRMRRIGPHGTDVDGIERYYALARKLCAETPPPEQAHEALREVRRTRPFYSLPMLLVGYFVGAAAFAVFFGGTAAEALIAGLSGIMTGMFLRTMTRLQVNGFFRTITASFLIAVICQTLTHFGVIRFADAAAIGALMLLVPGMMMTDSMRDIIYGDTLSGVNKLVQVFLTTAALLLGTGTALWLSHAIWDAASVGISLDVPYPWWVQVAAAAFSCGGYCILFNIRTRGLLICMAGGGLGWAVWLLSSALGAPVLFCNFAAAAGISLFAEIMARVRKFPAFSYLVIALLPLVPGAGVYYTVEYLLAGEETLSMEQAVRTAATAGLLAVGILMVSSLFRMANVAKQLRRSSQSVQASADMSGERASDPSGNEKRQD